MLGQYPISEGRNREKKKYKKLGEKRNWDEKETGS
jgi:hypothetical protein